MEETIRVCCAILMNGGLVLCAQRSASMSLPHKWEFPGGKIEPGEPPRKALQREIREELDVEIEILKEFAGNVHRYSANKIIELIPFLGRIVGGEVMAKEPQPVKWVATDDLHRLDWAEADVPIVLEFVKWYQSVPRDKFEHL